MKNRLIAGITLFILFSTFISQKKITINKFKIQEIEIENNIILSDQELINFFSFLFNRNIIFLNSNEIKKKIEKKSFIKKLEIKKIFPDKIVLKIFEKKPIAILIDKQKKNFYLGENIELIEYRDILEYENLPIVYGDHINFKKFLNNLIKINFPIDQIKRYRFLEINRWDIEMSDKKILKLPAENYTKDLINYISIKDKANFEKYKIFDYRLNNQLILK